ncbi:MarR family transcriptional regulator [Kribbella sp. NBC_01505]|uniref:MarR family transcriptional regulator n=1 Tax=Kribbella sp. NBC_01505 TaxID=2903580 RepID=UPI00386F7A10
MLRIHFTPQDLARTTIATEPTPMWELLLSLHILQHQDGRPYFTDWRRRVLADVPPEHTRLLLDLAPSRGYSPDFLTPSDTAVDFATGLGQVLATPWRDIDRQLELLRKGSPGTTWRRAVATGRQDAHRRLGRALRVYHDTAIAPYWQSLRTHVAADSGRQTDKLARQGLEGLLSSLNTQMHWEAPVLHIVGLKDSDYHLGGRGLHLQASAFCWRVPTKLFDPELRPVLVYPIQHQPGLLRHAEEGPATDGNRLPAVLGATRAAALAAAVTACTTTELARRCGVSPASASQQAAALREAGLITRRRVGGSVLHLATPLGLRLLAGDGTVQ